MKLFITILLILNTYFIFSQGSVEETLKAERLNEKFLFIEFDEEEEIFKYSSTDNSLSFIKLDPNKLFLLKPEQINLFIKPLNPLKYQIKSEKFELKDKEYEEMQVALNQILTYLSPLVGLKPESELTTQNSSEELKIIADNNKDENAKRKAKIEIIKKFKSDHLRLLKDIVENEERIKKNIKLVDLLNEELLIKLLKLDDANTIDFNTIFYNFLKELMELKYSTDTYEIKFKELKKNYEDESAKLNAYINLTKNFTIPEELIENGYGYINLGIYSLLDHTTERNTQFKKISDSFKSVYEIFSKWENKIKKFEGYYPIEELALTKGKISGLELQVEKRSAEIKNSAFQFKPVSEVKEKISFKKFDHFVFELRPGIAFVNLSFPNYVLGSDDEGNNVVAEGEEENFNKINLQVMLNANYNIPNSAILPFLQLGIGPSSKYPILFTGAGFRIMNNLSISFGGAWTWVNSLNKLTIGESVTDQVQIENDQEFKFTNNAKFYCSLQIKM
ncbi:hypothetical protein CSC80_06630 [Maribacter sp. 6B07]|uniref:hypothetical protein n=1 Tax=Maribacter sp. 6B07 TaxID=2045442 RepID=UPI000C06F669|nr:hypothetical protein [Maribacter sp. 6B07]PHN95004.1 hypothetical protein CSC80_06630 [Maribacter sp. 6B07]